MEFQEARKERRIPTTFNNMPGVVTTPFPFISCNVGKPRILLVEMNCPSSKHHDQTCSFPQFKLREGFIFLKTHSLDVYYWFYCMSNQVHLVPGKPARMAVTYIPCSIQVISTTVFYWLLSDGHSCSRSSDHGAVKGSLQAVCMCNTFPGSLEEPCSCLPCTQKMPILT